MPRVRFASSFDYRPSNGVVIAYSGGWSGLIPTAHAAAAKAAFVEHVAEANGK